MTNESKFIDFHQFSQETVEKCFEGQNIFYENKQ